MTTRSAYEAVGGHEAVKSSFHDGLTLPRAYRRAGFFTDLCDASDLATCRMYRSARAVWFGLAKNAREGLASTGQIWFWTVVLLCGQVLPFVIAWSIFCPLPFGQSVETFALSFVAFLCCNVARGAAGRNQTLLSIALHPLAIVLLLTVQWYAICCAILGKPIGWKGRGQPIASPAPQQ
jgi:hypothetical protein